MDDIIVFNPLSREHLDAIIEIQIRRVAVLLEAQGPAPGGDAERQARC